MDTHHSQKRTVYEVEAEAVPELLGMLADTQGSGNSGAIAQPKTANHGQR